jgi:hypothetical protein
MIRRIKILIIKIVDKHCTFIRTAYIIRHTENIVDTIARSAYIISPLETLDEIESYFLKNISGVYLRFGDGDVYLSQGKSEMLQGSNTNIQKEMVEALELKGNNILKTSMIHSNIFGKMPEMFIGNHLVEDDFAIGIIKSTFQYYVGYKIYSHIGLHYTATYYPHKANSFLKSLKRKTVLFIGNENTPSEIVRLLFGDVPHIKTPSRNSYDRIDNIEMEAIKELDFFTDFVVVVVAMGCSGRVLMKRLYKKDYNVFLFDFGSLLDGICGVHSRQWLQEVNINYEVVLNDL